MDDGEHLIPKIAPVHLTPPMRYVAADCGGFVATNKWGDYKYHSAQYTSWCYTIGEPLRWAAMMDLCVEPEITEGDRGLIRERQDWTTQMAEKFYETYMDAPWAWVPTLQGWEPEDYLYHARKLRPLIDEMQNHYYERPGFDECDEDEALFTRVSRNFMDFRVGIGTLCRRASVQQIREIVSALVSELPGVRFHLWGVKLSSMQGGLPDAVASVDSAAWNGRFGTSIQKYAESDLSQKEYGYQVALPDYVRRVEEMMGRRVRLSVKERGGLRRPQRIGRWA